MRRFALLVVSLLSACGASKELPVFFDESSAAVECTRIDALSARGSSVADVSEAGDSAIVVLYDSDREIVRLNTALQPVATTRFERQGPRGVRQAKSLAFANDKYYVADAGEMAVKVLNVDGEDQGLIRLEFVPNRVRAAGVGVFVTPMVFANNPSSMLASLGSGKPRLLDVPIAAYEDLAISAFANLGSIVGFPDGRVVVMHEFVVPFGYSYSPGSAQASIHRYAVPLPATMRSRVDRLPKPPITEANIGDLLAVALTATANPRTGGLFYLTRTGKRSDGGWEKMIVEVDSSFNFVRWFAAPGRPQHMVFFAARSSILLVDDEGQWHECKLT